MAPAEHERPGSDHRVDEGDRVGVRHVPESRQADQQRGERCQARDTDGAASTEPQGEPRHARASAEGGDPDNGPDRKCGRLSGKPAEPEREERPDGGKGEPWEIRGERRSHRQHGEQHNGDGDQLEPVHPTGARDVGRAHREREHGHRDRGRQREAEPGGERAETTCAVRSDRDPELARRRPRQEVRDGDELGELLLVEPPAAADVLVAEVADVRDGAAERGHAEPQGGPEDLGDRSYSRVAPGFQSGSS